MQEQSPLFIPDQQRLCEIRFRTGELRLASGVAGEVMLPLNTIAALLQFRISLFQPQENQQNISGAIDYPNRTIFVNGQDAIGRQRFTIAHEMGHLLLHSDHPDISGWSYDYRTIDDGHKNTVKEQETDLFAAELLMPIEIFEEQWMRFSGSASSVAQTFQVSIDAVQYRRDFLNYEKFASIGKINDCIHQYV